MTELSQFQRLIVAVLEVTLLLVIQRAGFGAWLPSPGPAGLWFYAALLNAVLASRLVAPFYEKPVDVLAYTVSALLAIWLSAEPAGRDATVGIALWISTLLLGFALTASCVAIVSLGAGWSRASEAAKLIGSRLGSARVAYSLVILFAVLAFYRDSAAAVLWIAAAWVLTVIFKPFEHIFLLAQQLRKFWVAQPNLPRFGMVVAYQSPGLVLIQEESSVGAAPGEIFGFIDPHRGPLYASFLDYVGREKRRLVRAYELPSTSSDAWQEKVLRRQPAQLASIVDRNRLNAAEPIPASVIAGKRVAGIVAPDSTLERLYFEIIDNSNLEEGRLVETYIGNTPVIYQIVGGVTREEVVYQKNTFGYARGQAQKIGRWNGERKKFELVKWLPLPNTPVFLKEMEEGAPDPEAVGRFPGTDYTARIEDIDSLVTHNTAILGILGVGKSMLAIELIERTIAAGIKVICLDLTNQYATELEPFYDAAYEDARLDEIQEAGQQDQEEWAENPQEGGSIPNLTQAIVSDIEDFLREDNPRYLKIYNPAELVATKQTSEPRSWNDGQWRRGASLWSVTPVEITKIVSEAALQLLDGEMTDKARVCLVYEEAHSLVPEWNSVVADGDRAATNGTARAILQGRKFGLGCLLITQRTANVTKTILNQCNTVFAMRTFDATGTEFLSNYIGKDYAAVLSSLPERHAVLFGKASSCENPILLRLNDRGAFVTAFRAEHTPAPLPDGAAAETEAADAGDEAAGRNFDDDIPF